MSMTRLEFQNNVLNFMDAESSARWSPALIQSVGGIVSLNEWSDILNQNQYYKFATRSVTTDANGCVSVASLTTGSGDTVQTFARVVGPFTDGNILWTETDYRYVPLATQSNYQTPASYQYYLAGDNFQLLPVQSGLALTVVVNYIPATIAQLAGDSSTVIFPSGYEWILVWVTAATLLLKGGAESQAASDLYSLADDARKNMLSGIARLTTRPTFALFQDDPGNWGGG
jgi:hypothetical protein